MQAAEPEPLELGVITKPHGVRGELKVQLHWSESTVLSALETVIVARAKRRETFVVESVRRSSKGALLKLEGVDSRDAAEVFRGARLYAERSALPPLAEDEYYLIDLVGFEVKSPTRTLGRVVDVRTHSTLDTLIVEDTEGRTFEQPLDDAWVEDVRFPERLVLLRSEDGLLEE
jgi:16S rRNA processing protein RimM